MRTDWNIRDHRHKQHLTLSDKVNSFAEQMENIKNSKIIPTFIDKTQNQTRNNRSFRIRILHNKNKFRSWKTHSITQHTYTAQTTDTSLHIHKKKTNQTRMQMDVYAA